MSAVIDPQVLGRRAQDWMLRLVNEIGPRPAGGDGETQARDLVREQARAWGYAVVEQPFVFPPQPRFFPYYTLLAAAFLLAAGLLTWAPWLCLLLPPLVAALPLISDALLARLPRTARSANLLVLPVGLREEELDLIFCAHLDSALAVPFGPEPVVRMSRQVDDAGLRLAWVLAALAFVPLLGLRLPPPIHFAALGAAGVLALILVGLDLWQQLGERGCYTHGANDNASGLGVLLALAEFLAADPPERLKTGFLFTGAEEAGLYGAGAYAGHLRGLGGKPRVLNVDMIGSGEGLRMITRAGPLFPQRTDPGLNAWLERAEPEIQPIVYRRRSGDFTAFTRRGIPAAGIEGQGTPRFWSAYHTRSDGPRLVELKMLERTASALARLVQLLDRNQGF